MWAGTPSEPFDRSMCGHTETDSPVDRQKDKAESITFPKIFNNWLANKIFFTNLQELSVISLQL